MNARLLFLLCGTLSLAALTGCERRTVVVEVPGTPAEPAAKTTTLETERLGKAIDDFDREPTAERKADVKKAFSRLDEEIAELEGRVARVQGAEREEANAKLKNLQSYRTAQQLRFTAAEAKAPFKAEPPAAERPALPDDRSGGEKIKDGAKEVGGAVKDAAKEVGGAIKDAVRQ